MSGMHITNGITHQPIVGTYSGHDANASLFVGGKLVTAIEKERLTREKHANGNCEAAVRYCLGASDAQIGDLLCVATSRGTQRYEDVALQSFGRFVDTTWDNLYTVDEPYRVHKLEIEGRTIDAYCVQHHICHCASTYFSSPFERAAILSIDGGGDFTHTMLALGSDCRLDVLAKPPVRLGAAYRRVAHRLGFPRIPSASGRVMALSAFGTPTYYGQLLEAAGGLERFTLDSLSATRLFGQHDRKDALMNADIAASIQRAAEDVIIHLCGKLHSLTGCRKLCLAGGVALNCQANRRILEETAFDEIFIPPMCSDSGISIGAALYVSHHIFGVPRDGPLTTASQGVEYSDAEIKRTIESRPGLRWERPQSITQFGAALIAGGCIVGWHQGGSEIGPRALGQRSLLADPRRAELKDFLNQTVKHREAFRPFAPSILQQYVPDYFTTAEESPFMLVAFKVRPDVKHLIPGVLHVDETARLQTVRKDVNPRFYELIEEFRLATGIPMVLNTSFNLQGMPIVETPEDSVDCFLKAPIDCLLIGDYAVFKK